MAPGHAVDGADDLAHRARFGPRRQVPTDAKCELRLYRRHLYWNYRNQCGARMHVRRQEWTSAGLVRAEQTLRLLAGRADLVAAPMQTAQLDDRVLDRVSFVCRLR
jgi:hypothetical protein